MTRIERLVNLIAALLETRVPMTAEQIRTRIAGYGSEPNYEAFRRTFERDKDALREMGIPLELATTDPFSDQPDGYIIPKGRYYLPELDLETDELAALRLAAEAVLGAGEEATTGYLKLSVDHPFSPSPGPRVVWGTDVAAEQPLLAPLYAALLDSRRVAFQYETAAGSRAYRTVEPYGLVHRRGHWYMLGRDIDRAQVRSFKLGRITSRIDTLEQTYERPRDFDSNAYVGSQGWQIGDAPTTAVVRFDRDIRWWAEQNLPGHPQSDAPAGALDVELPVANLDALVSWAIGFGPAVEILAPEAARRRIVDHISAARQDRS